jgi:hypothetical protein
MTRRMSRESAANGNQAGRSEPSAAALPPVVRAFVQRHAIPPEAVRAAGRLVITVDRRYRVHVMPAPHNRVALQAELLPLSDPTAHSDDTLMRLAQAACGLLQMHASTPCIDAKRQALVLQQTFDAGGELSSFEDALADFANALAFWRRICERETAIG